MNLLQLPVDQYQRYRLATDIVNAVRADSKSVKVVEVGGNPPKLDKFLPDDKVVITDRSIEPGGSYLSADALTLPFADESFDVVVSLDVLEHIPTEERAKFAREMARVASSFVIIAAPFDDGKNLISGAEKLIFDYIKDCHEYEHDYFMEHIKYGLPYIYNIIDIYHEAGWSIHTLPNGYFPRWFSTILMEYTAAFNPLVEEILHKLREYYNYHFYARDNREPAYRHAVIAARNGFTDDAKLKISSIASASDRETPPPMEYAATLIELARLNAEAVRKERIKGLEHDLKAREDEIDHLKRYVSELENFTNRIKGSLPYKLYENILKKK